MRFQIAEDQVRGEFFNGSIDNSESCRRPRPGTSLTDIRSGHPTRGLGPLCESENIEGVPRPTSESWNARSEDGS